jgi:transcriptional regulator with XRE-family HTH domain
MFVLDLHSIGNKLFVIRKKKGLTQAEVAEKADLSDRAYADIERGSVTMRIDTLLKICSALHVTPNDILVEQSEKIISEHDIAKTFENCSANERNTALKILSVYIDSLK